MEPEDNGSESGGTRGEELVEVAARLFRENGYDATSMQHIADEIGILKGSLYHYVRSKEDLLWLIVEPNLRAIHEEVEEILGDESEPLVKRIGRAIEAHMSRFEDGTHMFVIARETGSSLTPKRYAAYGKMREDYGRLWRDAIQAGIDDGEVRDDLDVRIAVHGILGMINWTSRWLPAQRQGDGRAGAAEFSRLVAEGIVAPPARP